VTDGKLHNLYFISKPKKEGGGDQFGLQSLEFRL